MNRLEFACYTTLYVAIFLVTLSVIWFIWGNEDYKSWAYTIAGLGILNFIAYRILKRRK